jgi:hypothetical protein
MKLNQWQIVGVVLILMAIAYSIWSRSRPATPPPGAEPFPTNAPVVSTGPTM